MPAASGRLGGPGLLLLLGGICFFATAVPVACSHGGGMAPAEAGATGGGSGGAPSDAAATGGVDGHVSDGPGLEVGSDSGGADAAVGGEAGTSTTGRGGGAGLAGAGGAGGMAGGRTVDGGLPDVAQIDGAGMDQGGAGGGDMSGGAAGADGASNDGGSSDAMFSCGPCSIHWSCGGASGTPYTYVTLVSEDDGCYLSGLPGHKLLAPDGAVTENGVEVARARRFGPQVEFVYPDGSQWLYCGGALPCSGTQ